MVETTCQKASNLGTDFPHVTTNRFRRGAQNFHHLGGGVEGQLLSNSCPWLHEAHMTAISELFRREL